MANDCDSALVATPTTSIVIQEERSCQMSPRSPLECEYDGQEIGETGRLPKEIVQKAVSFAPPVDANDGHDTTRLNFQTSIDNAVHENRREGASLSSPPSPPQETVEDFTSPLTLKNEKRRRIQWAKRVRIKEIRHVNDYSESERDAMWMCMADMQMTKTMVKTTVMMMMRGEHIDENDPDFCTRGLEFRTKDGSKIRSRYKLRTRSAVLNEQDLQRDEGFFDPQFIAMASMEGSLECREAARQRGVEDAKCIETYLDDVRKGIRGITGIQ
jgi:hypothetical protein